MNTITMLKQVELAVLRAAARGELRLGRRTGEYLHNDRKVASEHAEAISAAVHHGYLRLSTDPASGVPVRADLTVAGFGRIGQLAHDRAAEPV